MGRIENKFKELKEKGKKALITFVTAGDPDMETTIELVEEMEKQGADIVELGIPYSDPVAEGPVIQRANLRALKNEVKLKHVFEAVKSLRNRMDIPIVFLLYYNCVLQYGQEKFFQDCSINGVDGIIIPDVPYEESEEIRAVSKKAGVDLISLVSPTSKERIKLIAENASGFLYCVSSLGVTGMRQELSTDFDSFFSYINRYVKIPTAIGFGISTPEQVIRLKKYSDGIIVGSAIVKKIEESIESNKIIKNAGAFVGSLRTALDA